MLIKNVKIVLGLIVIKGVNVIATVLDSFRNNKDVKRPSNYYSNELNLICIRLTNTKLIPVIVVMIILKSYYDYLNPDGKLIYLFLNRLIMTEGDFVA